ncbi:17139_t:CDS:1, partial [Gigaspora rosea]
MAERVELSNEEEYNKATEEEKLTILGYEINREGSVNKNYWPS